MDNLSGRTVVLKKRADRLKQTKLVYLSEIDTIKQIEKQKDKMIAAISKEPIDRVKRKKKKKEVMLSEDNSLSWKPKKI